MMHEPDYMLGAQDRTPAKPFDPNRKLTLVYPPESSSTSWMPRIRDVQAALANLIPGIDLFSMEQSGQISVVRTMTPGRDRVIDTRVLEKELASLGHQVNLASIWPRPQDVDGASPGDLARQKIREAMPVPTAEEKRRRDGGHPGVTTLGGDPLYP